MACDHEVAPHALWPWLPKVTRGDVAKHPYCTRCGVVAVVGSDRAVKKGTLVNVLSALSRRVRRDGRRLTEAHRRLVLKRLEEAGATDRFGLTRRRQFEMLLATLHEVTGLEESYLEGAIADVGSVRV